MQNSHHEKSATTVCCCWAFCGIHSGFQTHRAKDQTQEVTEHHQEDQTAQGHTNTPSGGKYKHISIKYYAKIFFLIIYRAPIPKQMLSQGRLCVSPDVLSSLQLWYELCDVSVNLYQGVWYIFQSRQRDFICEVCDLYFYVIQQIFTAWKKIQAWPLWFIIFNESAIRHFYCQKKWISKVFDALTYFQLYSQCHSSLSEGCCWKNPPPRIKSQAVD